MTFDPVPVGIVGCGTISDAYFETAAALDEYDVVACADIDTGRAEEKGAEYGAEASDVETFLAESEAEVAINLTPPSAHAAVCEDILEAGMHAYVEKPLAADLDAADGVLATAAERDLLVGVAPDTFLGAGIQTAREVLDSGRVGRPVGATAVWTSSGHETWHPSPGFFYKEGGGPLLDMGPYYVTALVSLLGPAERVTGCVTRGFEERTITSEPRAGETVDVEVPTHESGVVEFANGAVANLTTSFDVQASALPGLTFELYGTDGTIRLPNPNHFEGPVEVKGEDDDGWETVELSHQYTGGRGAGVADLARAVRTDWEQRASGALGRHVLAILTGIRRASDTGGHTDIDPVERPAPLPPAFPGN
jgi:predicted dehydrogenase